MFWQLSILFLLKIHDHTLCRMMFFWGKKQAQSLPVFVNMCGFGFVFLNYMLFTLLYMSLLYFHPILVIKLD